MLEENIYCNDSILREGCKVAISLFLELTVFPRKEIHFLRLYDNIPEDLLFAT